MASLALLAGCTGLVEQKTPATLVDEDPSTAEPDASKARRDGGVAEPDEFPDPELDNVVGDGGGEPDEEPGNPCEGGGFPLAQGLHIRELALYQTVKIPLYANGSWVSQRNAPVVQNKKALVRVFVDPLDGYQAHDVRAVLRLRNGGKVKELLDERAITGASTDAQLASTFSFQVEPSDIGGATELAVDLVETNCGAESGAEDDARLPAAGGTHALDAQAINKLEVVVVPVNIDGRLPVTTDKELDNMRSALLAFYPVPDVEISVREPLEWTSGLSALDGNTWSDLLNQVMRQRRTDAPGSNVYYFGLVQPAATFRTYCQRGCVLGLAPQTTSVMANAQVALGASFADAQTYETMIHELGHAHGRGHAPCVEAGEIDGVDMSYPEPTGATNVWGWDSRTNTLRPPSDKDIMGYCEPNWISAYNYAALARRSQQVNLQALRVASDRSWLSVLLYDDGRARWGGDMERQYPAGEVQHVDVLDEAGAVIEQTDVVRVTLSHVGAQFLYVPQPGANWSALRLPERTLPLAAVLPPL